MIKWVGVVLLLLVLAFSLEKLPLTAGKGDFRAYWSASYLLAHGQNFADQNALLATQHELTGYDKDYAMKTWNPPWILVWLLPYSWVRFEVAANLWLVTNIAVLLLGVVVSWQMFVPIDGNWQKWLWLPLLTAVLFPSTIVSLLLGQVNLLVLGGVVGFLAFYRQGKDVASGLALTLTTFKPHLVYLVVPILLFQSFRQKRWGVSSGFFGLLVLSTAVAFILRPNVVADYLQGTTAGNLLGWETATFVTYLSLKTGWLWVRLLAVGLLPMALVAWFYWGEKWNLAKVTQVGILMSLITMPFGWSYDFVLLLLPLTQMLVWLITKHLPDRERVFFAVVLLGIYGAYYFQRIATPSELYFFWVPLVIAALYGIVAWRVAEQSLNVTSGNAPLSSES